MDGGCDVHLESISFACPNIELISGEDSGPFDAMNKALSRVSSEFVIFMNAGDEFHPQLRMEDLVLQLQQSRASWGVGRTLVARNGSPFGEWAHPSFPRWARDLGVQSWNHQSTLYRTSFLKDNGGFSADQVIADWGTALKLEALERPLFFESIVAIFDTSGVSSRVSFWDWIKGHVRERDLAIGKGGAHWWVIQVWAYLLLRIDALNSIPRLKRFILGSGGRELK
jgi:hypothetical protein